MNHSDSERITGFLADSGLTDSPIEKADVVIFNTCGIRQAAENRAYSFIHNLRKKRKNSVTIIMTGCLAHRQDVQKRMRHSVDAFTTIESFQKNITPLIKQNATLSQEEISYLSLKPRYHNTFQASIPIMTGCNNFCSYCVVPYARGKETSRSAKEIIAEISNLIKNGCRSITLLGQNVNSYCDDNDTKNAIDFPKLLKMIDAISGDFWISFASSHPKDMSDELIETIASCNKVCEWIHLPLQAGNDDVLTKMNRKYTSKQYLSISKKIHKAFAKHKPTMPHSITTDIIVGFPGEKRTQFMDSAKVMEKVKFDMAFFGQFSPRPGTAAWKMKDSISKREKKRREEVLNAILKETAFEKNKKYIGKELCVLIEEEKNGWYFGKTRTMKNVKVSSKEKGLVGSFKQVLITNASIWNLEATDVLK